MFAVGVDVSNGRSTVAVLQSKTSVLMKPFEIPHTAEGFASLAGKLASLDGEVRIVMEHTGRYIRLKVNPNPGQPIRLLDAPQIVQVCNQKMEHLLG